MKISIAIFEDNDYLRNSIAVLLETVPDFEVVGSLSNCRSVLETIETLRPTLVLMDIDMPGVNGIEAVKEIRSYDQSIPVIMLTVFDDTHHVYNAMCAGASGYLLKRHLSERLITSIFEVLEGGAPMSPSIAKMVINSFVPNTKSVSDKYQLTSREKEILTALSNGSSYKLVASKLKIRLDTVRTHIKHIYDKLQVHSKTEAVTKAIQEKLV